MLSTSAAPTMEDNIPRIALEQLATRIYANATKMSWYLHHQGPPKPSFPADPLLNILPSEAPQCAHKLRYELKQDAMALFRLASGPSEYVAHVALNHQYTVCLRYLTHFNIFSNVPTTGSISLSNLSIITSAPLPQLTSVIGMAMTSGLFTSPAESRIAHSPTSLLLAISPEFGSWATCASQYMFDASAALPTASTRWGRSQERNHSAFNLAFDTQLPFPQYLAETPSMGRDMGQFLKATQMINANDPRHLVNGFDWKALEKALVVDIGSTGASPAIALAKAFPSLTFEIQAAPQAIFHVEKSIVGLEKDLASRISWNSKSMFVPQPATNGAPDGPRKVYVLRHVLHNLPDGPICSILGNLMSVLNKDDRIIIMELVLPEFGEVDSYQDGMVRTRDMIQRAMSNTGVRTRREWTDLLQGVSERVDIVKWERPNGSDLSLLEIQSNGQA